MPEWTEKQVERLRELLKRGATCSDVAAELGFSRNAVIGKAHREKITARPMVKPQRTLLSRPTANAIQFSQYETDLVTEIVCEFPDVTLREVSEACGWPQDRVAEILRKSGHHPRTCPPYRQGVVASVRAYLNAEVAS